MVMAATQRCSVGSVSGRVCVKGFMLNIAEYAENDYRGCTNNGDKKWNPSH